MEKNEKSCVLFNFTFLDPDPSVSDPDPDWIRIQIGSGFRGPLDPDSGSESRDLKKVKNVQKS